MERFPFVFENIQTELDEFQRRNSFPGATVAFALADAQCIGFATGYSDRENRVAMQVETRMLAGSVGKTFTSATVLSLVQAGKLNLDVPIKQWLDTTDWFSRIPNHRNITLRMLLNHSSGLPNHNRHDRYTPTLQKAFGTIPTNPDFYFSSQELLQFVFDQEPLFAAGQSFAYSNTGYILIGVLIEQVCEKPYYEELRQRFLHPLNLNLTEPAISRQIANLSVGYLSEDNLLGLPIRNMRDGKLLFNPANEWTDGGLVSNTIDLARWAKLLYEGKLMTGNYLSELLTAIPRDEARQIYYGLGVTISETEFGKAYGHSGWSPGYQSVIQYFPEYEVAIAMQMNTAENVDIVGCLHLLFKSVL